MVLSDQARSVRAHTHELGIIGRVTHVLDDRRKEKRERVNRAEASHANKHVNIDFPVLDGLPHVFNVEVVG